MRKFIAPVLAVLVLAGLAPVALAQNRFDPYTLSKILTACERLGTTDENGSDGAVFYLSTMAAGEDSMLVPPARCSGFMVDLVMYTVADGPCSLDVYSGGVVKATLIVPFPGLNMGAQGSFVPVPIYYPWACDSIDVTAAESLFACAVTMMPGKE